jgi:hypothetical protein
VAHALLAADTQYQALTHLLSRINSTYVENRGRKKPSHNGNITGDNSDAAATDAVLCVLGYAGSGLQGHRSAVWGPVRYISLAPLSACMASDLQET